MMNACVRISLRETLPLAEGKFAASLSLFFFFFFFVFR